jgi:hypothetical protein
MNDIKETNGTRNIPRMRTLPKAYAEIKALDPNTAFTMRALRRMVNTGELPVVQINSKKLINLDLLLNMLSCYTESAIRDDG